MDFPPLFALVAILLFFSSPCLSSALMHSSDGAQANWSRVDLPNAPSPIRGEFTFTPSNGSIWLFGGCDISFSTFYNDLWELHAGKSWRRIKTLGNAPLGRCGHGAAVMGGQLYVYGGLTADGISDELFALDLSTMEWSPPMKRRASSTWPPPRALLQHSLVSASPPWIVLASGISPTNAQEDTYAFNTITGEWETIGTNQLNQTDVGGSSLVYNDRTDHLVIFGGYRTDERKVLYSLGWLDLNDLHGGVGDGAAWSPVSSPGKGPGPLAFHAAHAYGHCMILDGGFSADELNGNLWALSMDSSWVRGTWRLVRADNRPPPHFASGFALLEDHAYYYGGRIHPAHHGEELYGGLWTLSLSHIAASCSVK